MIFLNQTEAEQAIQNIPVRPHLVYIDPPFNTGKLQKGTQGAYEDSFPSHAAYIDWLSKIVALIRNTLAEDGSFFLHLDPREVHYAKVACDAIFGRSCFQNEIIWAYDYGGRTKSKWSAKHDNILWYSLHPTKYTYNYDAIDRVPYMAPGLVGPEKAAKGKTPTDTWWHTIVPTQGKERVGYPTQKPLGVLSRIISVHTNPGDVVLDCFAGSGTTGVAAAEVGRVSFMSDKSPQAVAVIQNRCETRGIPCLPWESYLPLVGV